jgi:hypothetical protein
VAIDNRRLLRLGIGDGGLTHGFRDHEEPARWRKRKVSGCDSSPADLRCCSMRVSLLSVLLLSLAYSVSGGSVR